MGYVSHGQSRNGSLSYKTWISMKSRCNDPKHHSYANYGGRGITICERWEKFENFLADMGERKAGMTIDRIDTNGNYEPSNCRWATAVEQQANKRNSILIECNGVKQTAHQWQLVSGIHATTIERRIKAGVPVEVAIYMPAFKGKPLHRRDAASAALGEHP